MLTIHQQGAILWVLNDIQQTNIGGDKMTDTNRLEQLIKLSGFKYSFIAESLEYRTRHSEISWTTRVNFFLQR